MGTGRGRNMGPWSLSIRPAPARSGSGRGRGRGRGPAHYVQYHVSCVVVSARASRLVSCRGRGRGTALCSDRRPLADDMLPSWSSAAQHGERFSQVHASTSTLDALLCSRGSAPVAVVAAWSRCWLTTHSNKHHHHDRPTDRAKQGAAASLQRSFTRER